jgi:hypothetical protein
MDLIACLKYGHIGMRVSIWDDERHKGGGCGGYPQLA